MLTIDYTKNKNHNNNNKISMKNSTWRMSTLAIVPFWCWSSMAMMELQRRPATCSIHIDALHRAVAPLAVAISRPTTHTTTSGPFLQRNYSNLEYIIHNDIIVPPLYYYLYVHEYIIIYFIVLLDWEWQNNTIIIQMNTHTHSLSYMDIPMHIGHIVYVWVRCDVRNSPYLPCCSFFILVYD